MVNGVGNGKFNPGGSVTRAQLATILYRMAGSESGTEPVSYTHLDVYKRQQWSDSFTQEDYKALVAKMFAGEVTVSNDTTTVPAVTNTTLNMQENAGIFNPGDPALLWYNADADN